MALDHATKELLAILGDGNPPPQHQLDTQQARTVMAGARQLLAPGPELFEVSQHRLNVARGQDVELRAYRPPKSTAGTKTAKAE